MASASDAVVVSEDAGETWAPLGSGLTPASVRRLFSTPAGWYAALASGGLVRLNEKNGHWTREGMVGSAAGSAAARGKASRLTLFEAVVNDLTVSGTAWFAATEEGRYVLQSPTKRGVPYLAGAQASSPAEKARSAVAVTARYLVANTDADTFNRIVPAFLEGRELRLSAFRAALRRQISSAIEKHVTKATEIMTPSSELLTEE